MISSCYGDEKPRQNYSLIVNNEKLLQEEYYAWLSSDAGQEALQNGYFKPQRSELSNVKRFQDAVKHLIQHQKENPNAILSMDTPFSLMTPENFLNQFAISLPKDNFQTLNVTTTNEIQSETKNYPSIDWTTKSRCVGPIKNQGQCGSCWAFGAISAIETIYCLLTGNLLTLSEQQLTSCVNTNYGCRGGWVDRTYQWIIQQKQGSFCSNQAYPYQGIDHTCYGCSASQNLGLKSYVQLQNENQINPPLQNQPIVVYVQITNSWQYYKGGILNIATGPLNHVVVVVGADNTNGIWKIRNSWGTGWGDRGYLYCKMGYGALQYPIYPRF